MPGTAPAFFPSEENQQKVQPLSKPSPRRIPPPLSPADQFDEASLVLLVAEVDEADEILDDDRPPVRSRPLPVVWAAALILFVLLAGPIALLLRWY